MYIYIARKACSTSDHETTHSPPSAYLTKYTVLLTVSVCTTAAVLQTSTRELRKKKEALHSIFLSRMHSIFSRSIIGSSSRATNVDESVDHITVHTCLRNSTEPSHIIALVAVYIPDINVAVAVLVILRTSVSTCTSACFPSRYLLRVIFILDLIRIWETISLLRLTLPWPERAATGGRIIETA